MGDPWTVAQSRTTRIALAFALFAGSSAVGCSKSTDAAVITPVCELGTFDCVEDTLRRCNDVGSGWDVVERCPPGTCISGQNACGGPVTPLESSAWVACSPAATTPSDLQAGDAPCVPVAAGANKIDPFEVTRAQYLKFWHATADGRNTLGLAASCGFKEKVDHTPDIVGWPSLTEAEARLPITGVDFCDARGYCRWAGKRLCGGTDGKPIVVPQADVCTEENRAFGEWGSACQAIDWARCNLESGNLAPVGSFPECNAGGVYDLFGNARELIDQCTDVYRQCRSVGDETGSEGNFAYCQGPPASPTCSAPATNYVPENRRDLKAGFRCCTD